MLGKSGGYIQHTMKINIKNIRKFNFQMSDTTSGIFQKPALIHKCGFLQDEHEAFHCHVLNGELLGVFRALQAAAL